MTKKILLIHSSIIPGIYLSKLQANLPCEVELFPLAPSSHVYDSISTHPDIFMFQADKKNIIVSENIAKAVSEKLFEYNINTINAGSFPTGKYPSSAILNAAKVGNYYIHNTEYTNTVILTFAQQNHFSVINVNQGYTRCSTVPVTEKALITSDKGITNKVIPFGLKVLLIRPEHVILNGQKYGFIGGASGTFIDGTTVFLGDITKHPDFNAIDVFFKGLNQTYRYLKGLPLIDAGSLIFVEKQ
ncbi:MAG: hypothetical protein PHQ52_02605 [Candidatus Omnitrophica bacterium]|nr:hypothetical protein [Candidatus Omnitrophota bacterium]